MDKDTAQWDGCDSGASTHFLPGDDEGHFKTDALSLEPAL